MYNLREKVHTICNKSQEHTDTINDLIELFEATLSEKNKKAQDEIDRLKEQHAEEITKMMQEVNAAKGMKELMQDDLHVTKCEFQGYRQAVKDILGGEG